jgi:hypothetical protein
MSEEVNGVANEVTDSSLDELATFTEGAGVENPDTVKPKKSRKKEAAEDSAEKPKREKKVKEPKEPKPPRDNIGRINGMTSIAEVRKALQIAIAKKAKANGKAEAVARYEVEIAAAREKLKSMEESAVSYMDFINMCEEPNRIITYYIVEKEKAFDEWVKNNNLKVSKRLLKTISDDIPEIFFQELPIQLHDALIARHNKTDYRLRATCTHGNLMMMFAAEEIKYVEGKWVDKEGKPIGCADAKVKDEE